jgi:hypothetical protein
MNSVRGGGEKWGAGSDFSPLKILRGVPEIFDFLHDAKAVRSGCARECVGQNVQQFFGGDSESGGFEIFHRIILSSVVLKVYHYYLKVRRKGSEMCLLDLDSRVRCLPPFYDRTGGEWMRQFARRWAGVFVEIKCFKK